MAEILTINNLPTLTWNWLKINSTPFSTDALFSGDGDPRISALPQGVEYERHANADAYRDLETGCGKAFGSHFFKDANASLLTVKKGVRAKEPVFIDFDLSDKSATEAFHIIKAEEGAEITVIMRYANSSYDMRRGKRRVHSLDKSAAFGKRFCTDRRYRHNLRGRRPRRSDARDPRRKRNVHGSCGGASGFRKCFQSRHGVLLPRRAEA